MEMQSYCPKCDKKNPGHAFGECPLLVCFNKNCGDTGHTKFNCPKMVCWICNEKGHTKRDCKKRAYGLPTPSEPRPGSSTAPAASPPTIIERPQAGASATAGGKPGSKPGSKTKGKAKALRNNRPTGQLARIIPKTEFTGSYADAVASTSASQAPSPSTSSTSKRPAEDEPASPATKLLKTYDDFKAKLEFNKQRLEDLAVEEQNLKKDYELKLKDLEARRAAVLADQDKELKLRQAMEKAEEFFSLVRSDVSQELCSSESVQNLSDRTAESKNLNCSAQANTDQSVSSDPTCTQNQSTPARQNQPSDSDPVILNSPSSSAKDSTTNQTDLTNTQSQPKPDIEIVDPKATPMDLDPENAKAEVIEYSDLEDHFPSDWFQEKGEDMDTDPPIKLSGAYSIGITPPDSSVDVKPPSDFSNLKEKLGNLKDNLKSKARKLLSKPDGK